MNYNDDLSEFRRLHDEMVNQPENRELEAAADLIIRRHYNDRDFMLEAIKTDPNVVEQLDPELKNDSSFIAEIVKNNPNFNWKGYGIDTSLAEESRLEGLLDNASTIPTDSAINTLKSNNTQGEQSMDDIIREQTEAMYDTRDEMIQDYLNQNQSQPDVSNTVEAPVASPVEPTPEPEKIELKDIDNTDVADLLSSITDFDSYLKDGVKNIEEINENLNQIVFPEAHLENYLSLEEYFNAEKNLPFGDKKFADLTDAEKNNLLFLYNRDMQYDRNKIISIIKNKYTNQKNAFVDAINTKTKQASRLVENFIFEMTRKKESLEMKIKWALEDIEQLENERKTPTTSFERAQEILEQVRNIQKEIDKNNALISNYNGLISLGNSYGDLSKDINGRVAEGKLDLEDKLKELDGIYDTINNARKQEEAVVNNAPVAEEVVATPAPIPEPVQEPEAKEEPEVKEEAKEEPAKEEPVVEEQKQEEPEVVEPSKVENVTEKDNEGKKENEYTNEAPGINFDPNRVARPEAKKIIAFRKAFNKTALEVPIAIGVGLALISTSPVSTLTVPLGLLYGAMAGGNVMLTKALHDKLQEFFLKRKVNKFAENFNSEVIYDYKNHEACFGYFDEEEKKYKVIDKFDGLVSRLAEKLEKEGSTNAEEEAREMAIESARKFKVFANGRDLTQNNLTGVLTPLFDRIGGVAVAESIPKQTFDQAREQGTKFFEKKKEQFLDLIKDRDKYKLSVDQVERIQTDADLADEVVHRKGFKGSEVVRKATELKNKLAEKFDRFFINEAYDEEFYDDYEDDEELENQRSEEVKQIVEEQNIDEEFAPEVPTEEAPVEETPVQVTEEDRQREVEAALFEDDLAKESAELQNDEVIDVENTNTYNPNVSYDEYNRWIDSLRNSESELDALHVSIGQDENLSEAEKQALQSKIEFMVSSTKTEDTGRSR